MLLALTMGTIQEEQGQAGERLLEKPPFPDALQVAWRIWAFFKIEIEASDPVVGEVLKTRSFSFEAKRSFFSSDSN